MVDTTRTNAGEMKRMKTQYMARQGDVLIERINTRPDGLKLVAREHGRVVLAHGEVTGHAHSIGDAHAELWRDDAGVTVLEVRDAVAALTHDEHATIALQPGYYRVTRQREYHEEAPRNVAD